MLATLTCQRVLRFVGCVLIVMCCYGAASGVAAAAGVCVDDGKALPAECTKEIRIYNNTARPLWAVVQGSIQLTDALGGCTVAAKGGGDVWLQAALGKTDECLAVKHDYYVFINPTAGIPKGGFVSIKLPWWSKQTTAADRYVDWWRGGRVILFDDKTAFEEIYKAQNGSAVTLAAGSPKPACNPGMAGNACNNVFLYRVKPATGISGHLPFQLNEYTFADVAKVTDEGTKGGGFIGFNQGYNVSNVDQIYLPLAIEPVRQPADVGYMGTTLSVAQFREQLSGFVKGGSAWPIYNNPVVGGTKMYPTAGVRVPSAQLAFAYYMNPGVFPDGKTPEMLPKNPPPLVQGMIDQWDNCTKASPVGCPQSAYYKAVNTIFLANYKKYAANCDNIPDWLKPVTNNPVRPKDTAYLFFIYGWVPFNVACANAELPVVDSLPPASHAIIDYNQMQYNYETLAQKPRWFNPYTHLIHADFNDGGLNASAYAFSIDDHASYLNNSGVNVPGGLIFAVGGPKGLVNGKPHAPPIPEAFKWFDFSIGLGKPAKGGAYWTKYGLCSETADVPFPTEFKGEAFVLGIDPSLTPINAQNTCPVTFEDSENRIYQFTILKAADPGITLPQTPIWPAHEVNPPSFFDPKVIKCTAKAGFVAPKDWCDQLNQVSRPQAEKEPGFYTIGAPPPVAG
jgi:hypothetical protein